MSTLEMGAVGAVRTEHWKFHERAVDRAWNVVFDPVEIRIYTCGRCRMVSRCAWEAMGRESAGRADNHLGTARSHRSPGREGSWDMGRKKLIEIRSENLCGDETVVNWSDYVEWCRIVVAG